MSQQSQRYFTAVMGFALAAVWIAVGFWGATICSLASAACYAAAGLAHKRRGRHDLRAFADRVGSAARPAAGVEAAKPVRRRPRAPRLVENDEPSNEWRLPAADRGR